MGATLDDAALDILFRTARTQNGWLPTPVSDAELQAIYDLMKWGPTSANCCPARLVFLRTPEAKARLLPALSPGNVDKTKAEDKHLFRVDELMRTGAACGLDVEFHANRTYETFVNELAGTDAGAVRDRYLQFFRNYARYCMSWDAGLMAGFEKHMPAYCGFVADASAGGAGPYMHGVFVCRKRG